MQDHQTYIEVEREFTSIARETWFSSKPLPDDWGTMSTDERFDWVQENCDDRQTHDEFEEGTSHVYSVEVEE